LANSRHFFVADIPGGRPGRKDRCSGGGEVHACS
jgi:hypothetical protein